MASPLLPRGQCRPSNESAATVAALERNGSYPMSMEGSHSQMPAAQEERIALPIEDPDTALFRGVARTD